MSHRRGLQSLSNKVLSLTKPQCQRSVIICYCSLSNGNMTEEPLFRSTASTYSSTRKSLFENASCGPELQIMRVNCSFPFPCQKPTKDRYGCRASVALPFFIRPLKEDINQHHYCRFPRLALLTERSAKGRMQG